LAHPQRHETDEAESVGQGRQLTHTAGHPTLFLAFFAITTIPLLAQKGVSEAQAAVSLA
jgi:hypothetical protein